MGWVWGLRPGGLSREGRFSSRADQRSTETKPERCPHPPALSRCVSRAAPGPPAPPRSRSRRSRPAGTRWAPPWRARRLPWRRTGRRGGQTSPAPLFASLREAPPTQNHPQIVPKSPQNRPQTAPKLGHLTPGSVGRIPCRCPREDPTRSPQP